MCCCFSILKEQYDIYEVDICIVLPFRASSKEQTFILVSPLTLDLINRRFFHETYKLPDIYLHLQRATQLLKNLFSVFSFLCLVCTEKAGWQLTFFYFYLVILMTFDLLRLLTLIANIHWHYRNHMLMCCLCSYNTPDGVLSNYQHAFIRTNQLLLYCIYD